MIVDRLLWVPGAFESEGPADFDSPERNATRAWVVVGSALVLILLATIAWATARFVTGAGSLPCQYHEAREGSGFEKQHGWTIDDVRNTLRIRLAVRPEVEPTAEPGTVVRISRCNVPRDADAVAYVAVRS